MMEIAHAVLTHIGVAGLVAIWIAKLGVGAVGLRLFRARRAGRKI